MEPVECQRIVFTREEFYEKLWTGPTTKIAQELGCSNVLIAKLCKAYGIPKPYTGYWAKLRHGKKPRKTGLSQCDDPVVCQNSSALEGEARQGVNGP